MDQNEEPQLVKMEEKAGEIQKQKPEDKLETYKLEKNQKMVDSRSQLSQKHQPINQLSEEQEIKKRD